MRLISALAMVLVLGAARAAADELFYCADGRTLAVDSSNRARLANDPCVKAWFEASKPKPPPPQTLAERRRAFLAVRPPPPCHCWPSPWRYTHIFTRW